MNQYIITEEGLTDLEKYFMEHKDDLFRIAWKNFKDKHISPYNPQAEPLCWHENYCERSTFSTCMGCDQSYKNVRKDGREKVLDKLVAWMKGRYDLPALKEKIEELREGKDGE
jgi:hypothetical protein